MKQIFRPIPLILIAFSAWMTWVCASLLQFDNAGNLLAHSYSIWGDWSAHFTFITALQERGFSWIAGDSPLFPGTPFQYPFLSHVFTYFFSLITRLDVIHATYVMSLILIFILPYTLFRLLQKLGSSSFAALLSTLCFLLIGGIQWMDSSLNDKEPLTNQFDQASVFTQFVLFEFFPQRAFLFGLLAFSGLLIYGLNQKKWTLAKAVAIGLGFSLFTLLHVHTWVAMGTLLLSLFVFPLPGRPGLNRKNIFIFGASVALASAGFLSFLLLRGNHGGSSSQWDIWFPGWAQNSKANLTHAHEMNIFTFWFYNTGLYLPLAFTGIYLTRKDTRYHALALAGLILFVVALFFNIQPYFYDNLKLFTYAFFFFAPFVGISLSALVRLKKIPLWAGYSLALGLTAFQVTSASRDFISFQNHIQNATFFTKDEFELAKRFKELRKSSDEIVLINPKHNHWVPCLTGNPVALGYEGWLWSWGINYGARDAQVREIFKGGPNTDLLLKQLQVSYIALQTKDQFGNDLINTPYFEGRFEKILSRGDWQVYSTKEVKSPSTSVR